MILHKNAVYNALNNRTKHYERQYEVF